MATGKKVASQFVNKVSWENDKASLKKVKDEIRKVKKEMQGVFKGGGMGGLSKPSASRSSPLAPSSSQMRRMDAHLKLREKYLKQQDRFESSKSAKIKGFFLSNRDLASLPGSKRADFAAQLGSTKSADELSVKMKEIRRTVMDTLAAQKQQERVLKQQNFAARRLNGSFVQLAGSVVSVYTGLEVGGAILRTGMGFEALNRTIKIVAGSTEEAKQEMSFLREESYRLGLDIVKAGKSYGRILAAGKGKVAIEDLRQTFTAVSEAGAAIGLPQDDIEGSLKAVSQMLGKSKVGSEELKEQLGDRLPLALKAMERAAQDAGLIPKNVKDTDLSAALFKLMEGGKVITAKVLPAFGKRLQQLARGEIKDFNKMLDETLSVNLGRGIQNLQNFQNTIYEGGFKDAIMFAIKGFNSLSKESSALGHFIGGVLSGAVATVVTPIRLVIAAFQDLNYLIVDTFDISQKTTDQFWKMAGAVTGVVGTIYALVKGFQVLRGTYRTLRGINEAFSKEKGGDSGLFSKAKPIPVYVVNMKGGGMDITGGGGSKGSKGKTGILSKAKDLAVGLAKNPVILPAAIAAGVGYNLSQLDEETKRKLSMEQLRRNPSNPNYMLDENWRGSGYGAYRPPEVKVIVSPDPELGNVIRAEAQNQQQNMVDDMASSFYGGGGRN